MATAKSTYYAWTDINNSGEVIKAGSKVSEGDFSEDDWAQLVEARSVRTREYPDIPAGFSGSPREFMVQELNRQVEETEGMISDDDLLEANQAADTGMSGEDDE